MLGQNGGDKTGNENGQQENTNKEGGVDLHGKIQHANMSCSPMSLFLMKVHTVKYHINIFCTKILQIYSVRFRPSVVTFVEC